MVSGLSHLWITKAGLLGGRQAQLLIKNCMQWKQLARAGRRKALLSEGDPVGPAEGKS